MSTQSDDLLRRLAVRLQALKAENEGLKRGLNDEPIAIIGIGCRLPGGARSLAEFGRTLASGVDSATRLPDERRFFLSESAPHWRSSLLDDVEQFDAPFFDLTPIEAAEIDPQQRLLLEVAYHAMEDARYPANQLRGRDVGVFVGTSSDDYQSQSLGAGGSGAISAFSVLGSGRSIAAGRIAYQFDLTGPVVQLDTACSSSLMAIHLACTALRHREASMALAGGVALSLGPGGYVARDVMKKLSKTGRCRPFSADADGFTRGEGCGLLLLKRLSDALEDEDYVHAVIAASAVNHNGRSNGMTAPNGEAQRRLMRRTLERAGVPGDGVDFVEPHGTGSVLGDSIEVSAIGDVFAGPRTAPLWLGSTKSRLGHLEAAAPVVSVIKACAMMVAETLLPDAPIERLNPHVDWERSPVKPLDAPVPWAREQGRPRRAMINALGVSGTNVCLVLSEAPEVPRREWSYDGALSPVLCVSGKTKESLLRNLRALKDPVRECARVDLVALASCLHKEHFGYRKAFVLGDRKVLLDAMESVEREALCAPMLEPNRAERLAFCFDGAGWSMATLREVYSAVPPFKQEVDHCLSACAGTAVDLTWLQTPEAERVHGAIALVGEYAMARTWIALGVRPSLFACAGQGTLSAAGALDIIDAAEMCGFERPEHEAERVASVSSRSVLPVVVASGGGFSQPEALTPARVRSSTKVAERWPTGAALTAARTHWLGGADDGPFASDETPHAARRRGEARPGGSVFASTLARLYEMGEPIDFRQLYALPRAAIAAALPGYRFDTDALWTARARPKDRQLQAGGSLTRG